MLKRLNVDPFLYRKIEKVSEIKKMTVAEAAVFLLERVTHTATPSRAEG